MCSICRRVNHLMIIDFLEWLNESCCWWVAGVGVGKAARENHVNGGQRVGEKTLIVVEAIPVCLPSVIQHNSSEGATASTTTATPKSIIRTFTSTDQRTVWGFCVLFVPYSHSLTQSSLAHRPFFQQPTAGCTGESCPTEKRTQTVAKQKLIISLFITQNFIMIIYHNYDFSQPLFHEANRHIARRIISSASTGIRLRSSSSSSRISSLCHCLCHAILSSRQL